jgi:hypothetical protein
MDDEVIRHNIDPAGMRLLTLALVACVACSGCDSQGDNDTGGECEGTISALAEPPNLTLYLGEDAASIEIGGDSLSFQHSAGRMLTYTGVTGNRDVVRAEVITGSTRILELLPIRQGSAKVEVQAEDDCGLFANVTFYVEVRDVCFEQDRAGLDVYFPVAVGNTWTYRYDDLDQGNRRLTYKTEGDMTWVVNTVSTCLWGEQTFSISEDIEGVITLPEDNPDYEESVSNQETRSGMLRGRHLTIEGYTDALDLQWLYPSESTDTLKTTLDTGSQRWETALVREQGLAYWQTMISDANGSRETGIVLTEQE